MNRKEETVVPELEEKIGYHFRDSRHLLQALMHSSYVNEMGKDRSACNERLEFLGDAVLELVSSEYLFQEYPSKPEGALTKQRAAMVCEPALAWCAARIELGSYLFLGRGEEKAGGRNRDSITSDAMEAVIGAIYLDGGFSAAREFISRHILENQKHILLFQDSKTILQETIQAMPHAGAISYELVREEGPDHDKRFTVQVFVGKKCMGEGQGHTKKAAEQKAAYEAICKIREH